MEIENLKLILETVKGVSGNAQMVAIWWLILDKLIPVVAIVFVSSLALWKIPIVILSLSRCHNAMVEFRDLLRLGSGYFGGDELNRTINKIRELIRKEEKP